MHHLDPTIAAALIAGGISVASFGFNTWTTSTTLHAARAANLRDRQAGVYQQILAYAAHQTEVRRNRTRTGRFEPQAEERLQKILDSYASPNWFELEANVLAFCPDSVVHAFIAAKEADDKVWIAMAAHAQAVELNLTSLTADDPAGAIALGAEFRARAEDAQRADSELIEIVRDKMLGTRPPEPDGSLLGKLIYEVRSRRSLR